jgi:hypothetical protein
MNALNLDKMLSPDELSIYCLLNETGPITRERLEAPISNYPQVKKVQAAVLESLIAKRYIILNNDLYEIRTFQNS